MTGIKKDVTRLAKVPSDILNAVPNISDSEVQESKEDSKTPSLPNAALRVGAAAIAGAAAYSVTEGIGNAVGVPAGYLTAFILPHPLMFEAGLPLGGALLTRMLIKNSLDKKSRRQLWTQLSEKVREVLKRKYNLDFKGELLPTVAGNQNLFDNAKVAIEIINKE